MKKISLSTLAILIAASSVMALDKTPVKKEKPKAATTKSLKSDKCVKGSKECKKKGC
ncbi:hypothetical protein [Mucilaginibacter sp.]|uniref:hypothetical protein n=1 Tax=Mucilaginibacter sp. TaxID=1882438 RepID=UPI00260E2976|nr:hypothetical protein [Mucilaginibacter sp.]MDB4924642.1 hypothetical protein [Mucilaginibacter sp.]